MPKPTSLDDIIQNYNDEIDTGRQFSEGVLHYLREAITQATRVLMTPDGRIDSSLMADADVSDKYKSALRKALGKGLDQYMPTDKKLHTLLEDRRMAGVYGFSMADVENIINTLGTNITGDAVYDRLAQGVNQSWNKSFRSRAMTHLKDDADLKKKVWEYVKKPEFVKPDQLDISGMGLLLDLYKDHKVIEPSKIEEVYGKSNQPLPTWYKRP